MDWPPKPCVLAGQPASLPCHLASHPACRASQPSSPQQPKGLAARAKHADTIDSIVICLSVDYIKLNLMKFNRF